MIALRLKTPFTILRTRCSENWLSTSVVFFFRYYLIIPDFLSDADPTSAKILLFFLILPSKLARKGISKSPIFCQIPIISTDGLAVMLGGRHQEHGVFCPPQEKRNSLIKLAIYVPRSWLPDLSASPGQIQKDKRLMHMSFKILDSGWKN